MELFRKEVLDNHYRVTTGDILIQSSLCMTISTIATILLIIMLAIFVLTLILLEVVVAVTTELVMCVIWLVKCLG